MKSRADQMTDFELGNQLSDWFDLKTESWSDLARRVRELFENPDVAGAGGAAGEHDRLTRAQELARQVYCTCNAQKRLDEVAREVFDVLLEGDTTVDTYAAEVPLAARIGNCPTHRRVVPLLVLVLPVDVVQSDGKIKTLIFERESPLDGLVPRVGEQVTIEHPSLGGGVSPKVESVTWLFGKGKLVVGLAMGRPIVGREASIIEGAGGWKRR